MNSPFPTYKPSKFKFQIITTGNNETFTLPLTDVAPGHNFIVYWGDNTFNEILAYNAVDKTHNYSVAGTYNITIIGLCAGFQFNNSGDRLKIKNVISWGSVGFRKLDFYGCSNLTSLPNERGMLVNLITASRMFEECSSLTSLPAGIFDGSVGITSFYDAFLKCNKLTSIPVDLFKYNVNITIFEGAFWDCTHLITVPVDIFRHNIAVTSFNSIFYNCYRLETIPADLFRYNTLATNFGYAFTDCNKAKYNINIFYATGDENTRFLNQSVNFEACFVRSSFTGIQGTAPDLWNCNFGTETPTKTNCFAGAGNKISSLNNYGDIPVEWK